MYMDDIKLFVKNGKELKTQILGVRICSQNIGLEFGIKKMHHANYKEQRTTYGR